MPYTEQNNDRFRNRSQNQPSKNGLYGLLGGDFANIGNMYQNIANMPTNTGNPLREQAFTQFRNAQGRQSRQMRQQIQNNLNPSLRGTGVTANAFNELAETEQNALGDLILGLNEQDMQYNQQALGNKFNALQGLMGVGQARAGLMGSDRDYAFNQQRFNADEAYRKRMLDIQRGQGWGNTLGSLLSTGLNLAFPGSGTLLNAGRDAFLMP